MSTTSEPPRRGRGKDGAGPITQTMVVVEPEGQDVDLDQKDIDVQDDVQDSPPAAKAVSETKAAKEIREQADLSIKDWLTSLAGDGQIRVHVARMEPKFVTDPRTGERKKCDGQVARYDRPVEVEELQEKHGGGTYQLRINKPDPKGIWRYMTAKTIEIAGDPRLDDVPRTPIPQQPPPAAAPSQPNADPLVGKMFDRMMDTMKNQQPQGPSQDATLRQIQMMLEPFKAQVDSLTQLLRAKDAEIASIRETAGKDPFRDTMMSKLLDQDTARLQAARTQHDSEIRILKEGFVQDEKRLRDSHERDIDRLTRTHEREISSLKASLEREIATLRQSMDLQGKSADQMNGVQKLVLEREIARLESELTTTKADLVALRARKDQTTAEKIHELNALKDLVSDDDKTEPGTLEKIIGAVGSLPVVGKLAERMGGGPEVDPQTGQPPMRVRRVTQAQAQAAQRPKLVRNRDTGQVSLVDPNSGGLIPVRKKAPTAEGAPSETAPSYDPAQVKQAVEYMENAFRAGTDAKVFAEGVRPMIPSAVMGSIRDLGIDGFLSKVAQLDGTSPLTTQGGRNWIRRVAKVLLGEAEE